MCIIMLGLWRSALIHRGIASWGGRCNGPPSWSIFQHRWDSAVCAKNCSQCTGGMDWVNCFHEGRHVRRRAWHLHTTDCTYSSRTPLSTHAGEILIQGGKFRWEILTEDLSRNGMERNSESVQVWLTAVKVEKVLHFRNFAVGCWGLHRTAT